MNTRVLIVDDEKMFADTLAKRLELRGLKTTPVYSGHGAMALLKETEFDVVVLDVKMPGLGGTRVLQEIRKTRPLVQVIMLTGHGTMETVIEDMKLGAFDFLTKPTDTEVLLGKIKEAAGVKGDHEERIRNAEIEHLITRKGW